MPEVINVRRTYKYRLYRNEKRERYLHEQITLGALVWNHALALQKRYYRLGGRYIHQGQMKSHIAALRRGTRRFAHWKGLGSQAVQDMLERQDAGYQKFFERSSKRPPKFKKLRQATSFTLKQTSGWELLPDIKAPIPKGKGWQRGVGLVEVRGVRYKFIKHRPLNGQVKTVTIKRDSCHRLWVCFSVVEEVEEPKPVTTGRAAGFDFGLKTFLVDHAGIPYLHPLFFKPERKRLARLQSRKDKKLPGSHNRRKAARLLARAQIRIADKRRDFHYKLAHQLCEQFDFLFFEDLNIAAMKQLWGRKVSDLGFAQFMEILTWVAFKRAKTVHKIGRFERTTGRCSTCGHKQILALWQRTFCCESADCGFVLDRDHNSARIILYTGASVFTSLGVVSPAWVGRSA